MSQLFKYLSLRKKVDENIEDKEDILVSNSNINNIEEDGHSDNLETENEFETVICSF